MLEYKCHYNNDEWISSIRNIKEEMGYSILDIEGKSSKIVTYLGRNDDQYWCFFPIQELSSQLSYPNDLLWNSEKLENIFGNAYDAITVARGIQEYHAYKQSVSSDIEQHIRHLKGKIYSSRISAVLYDKTVNEYHLIFNIRKTHDICNMLSFIDNDKDIRYYYDLSEPFITQLNYYYGHCQILEDSEYIGRDYTDIIKTIKERYRAIR